MENLKKELFKFFGEGELVELYESFRLTDYNYTNDKFHVNVLDHHGLYLVMVDLHSCFNKTSQCPLCFSFDEYKPLSKRKTKRIQSAINFLLRNEKNAGTFFSLPGFDDLDQSVRSNFYATISKK